MVDNKRLVTADNGISQFKSRHNGTGSSVARYSAGGGAAGATAYFGA